MSKNRARDSSMLAAERRCRRSRPGGRRAQRVLVALDAMIESDVGQGEAAVGRAQLASTRSGVRIARERSDRVSYPQGGLW